MLKNIKACNVKKHPLGIQIDDSDFCGIACCELDELVLQGLNLKTKGFDYKDPSKLADIFPNGNGRILTNTTQWMNQYREKWENALSTYSELNTLHIDTDNPAKPKFDPQGAYDIESAKKYETIKISLTQSFVRAVNNEIGKLELHNSEPKSREQGKRYFVLSQLLEDIRSDEINKLPLPPAISGSKEEQDEKHNRKNAMIETFNNFINKPLSDLDKSYGVLAGLENEELKQYQEIKSSNLDFLDLPTTEKVKSKVTSKLKETIYTRAIELFVLTILDQSNESNGKKGLSHLDTDNLHQNLIKDSDPSKKTEVLTKFIWDYDKKLVKEFDSLSSVEKDLMAYLRLVLAMSKEGIVANKIKPKSVKKELPRVTPHEQEKDTTVNKEQPTNNAAPNATPQDAHFESEFETIKEAAKVTIISSPSLQKKIEEKSINKDNFVSKSALIGVHINKQIKSSWFSFFDSDARQLQLVMKAYQIVIKPDVKEEKIRNLLALYKIDKNKWINLNEIHKLNDVVRDPLLTLCGIGQDACRRARKEKPKTIDEHVFKVQYDARLESAFKQKHQETYQQPQTHSG